MDQPCSLTDDNERSAEKETYMAIKDFSKRMYDRLGVRLVVLSAYVDPKESVIITK
jgi:hypothetical protein